MACFADINISQGSVATYVRCGGIFNIHLTKKFTKESSSEIFFKSVKIWQNYGHESVVLFLAHRVDGRNEGSISLCVQDSRPGN